MTPSETPIDPYGRLLIDAAQRLATAAHRGQTEWGGGPYIDHPRRVAAMLERAGQEPVAVAVAWLHDTLEDTDLTAAEIEAQFGDRVAGAVSTMTRQPGQTYRQLIEATLDDPITAVDKLADVVDHLEPERLDVLDTEGLDRAAGMHRRYVTALGVLVPACSDMVSRGILVPATRTLINRANELCSMS